MKDKNPLYYNSLVDKHTSKYMQKADVKKHLHQMGFTAVDGTVYPTRQEQIEANRVNRLLEESQAMLRKLDMREQSRLRRLGKAARAGELTFTKNGVYEADLCDDCHVYHKLASKLNITSPCPSSYLGRRQVQEQEQEKIVSKVRITHMCKVYCTHNFSRQTIRQHSFTYYMHEQKSSYSTVYTYKLLIIYNIQVSPVAELIIVLYNLMLYSVREVSKVQA